MSVNIRLSVMMFLQFFIWGSWFVTLATFLGASFHATGSQTATAFSSQCWGAIAAPFIVGLIADRYFNAERILGVLHLVGGGLMLMMARASTFDGFLPYVMVYMTAYMPTLALVNAVSFRQLRDPATQFGWIRVWGTLGWIIAGLAISALGWDSQAAVASDALANTFLLAAGASFALGAYSFTLPATPPAVEAGASLTELLGGRALWLLRDRNYAIFFLASVLICIPLGFYYQNASPFLTEVGAANSTAKLALGQVSEVLFMLLLPVFLGRFGIKATLLVGMGAWAARYGLFALGFHAQVSTFIVLGILLHGACYDFFFVCGQIYTDRRAGADCRSSAQGMITLATYGVGMLIGFRVAGAITDLFATSTGHDWLRIWLVPAALAAAIFVLFMLAFRPAKAAG